MLYKLCFILKTLLNAAVLPWSLQALPLGVLLLYLLMLRDRSEATIDSEHFSDNKVPKRYCEQCHRLMFYRMNHCKKCNVCIHRFDHHCLLLEVCIGEFNHRWYLLFLPVYTLCEFAAIWASLIKLPGQVADIGDGIEELQSLYYFLVLNIFLGIFAGVLCLVLVIKHVKLVIHGSTTWEEARRDSIEALKIYNDRGIQYPFDEGCSRNLQTLFQVDRSQPR